MGKKGVRPPEMEASSGRPGGKHRTRAADNRNWPRPLFGHVLPVQNKCLKGHGRGEVKNSTA